MMMKAERRSVKWLVITVYSAVTAAAHGLSSFSSYQCAAAGKAVFSAAVAVTHAVTATAVAVATTAAAITAVVTTVAVAKLKKQDNPGLTGVSFFI